MRLNLGCGNDIREGYVNVDFRATHPAVREVDLSVFPWPFDDESADEILMLDFLEHFPRAASAKILLECRRILTHSGRVIIQVPDAQILARVICGGADFPCNRCGANVECVDGVVMDCDKCGQCGLDAKDAAIQRMFGGQDYAGNFHQNAFDQESLMYIAGQNGLKYEGALESEHQALNWNFKLSFVRGDLW